ncbi:MAG: hypothetical protein E7360_03105 [Clostridiales bacterium]|nr:hypothetical protein [Clostridiales bacterium]
MKSKKLTYKDYPLPIRIAVAYVVLCLVGIVAYDWLATQVLALGVEGFADIFVGVIVMLIAFIVEWAILTLILKPFCGKKIYRGIGLYRATIIISIFGIVGFIGMIVYLKIANIEYHFLNFSILLLEGLMPLAMTVSLRFFTRRCNCCGLINTFKHHGGQARSLGKERKYHNEGGYYKEVKTTGTIERPWYNGGNMKIEASTKQYVPQTKVSDGVFEKVQRTINYRCSVCGNVVAKTYTTENKISD